MARWTKGESDIAALIAAGELQKLTGDAANGERLLKKAAVTLRTARSAIESDPDSAFVLAYDSARQALTAVPSGQGERFVWKPAAAVGVVADTFRDGPALAVADRRQRRDVDARLSGCCGLLGGDVRSIAGAEPVREA